VTWRQLAVKLQLRWSSYFVHFRVEIVTRGLASRAKSQIRTDLITVAVNQERWMSRCLDDLNGPSTG
jgi:hypothetical protein